MVSTIPCRPSAASVAAKEVAQNRLEDTIRRVSRLVNMAKKPIIYAGQGVLASSGPRVLREFADKACIPVTTTVQGLGAFDELDDKSLHMLGMHGSPYANLAMQEADLIVGHKLNSIALLSLTLLRLRLALVLTIASLEISLSES